MLRDKFYNNFYDPTYEFKTKEPRYFCYEIAEKLINKAKKYCAINWYESEETIKGILLLLFCWNFPARETKKLTFEGIRKLLSNCKEDLKELEHYTIENIPCQDKDFEKRLKKVYVLFKQTMGQTGASKALSLLNPKLFVMWDSKIRKFLRQFMRGIDDGKKPENYLKFLLEINKIIHEKKIKKKLAPNSIIAKKIDEYHYIKIVRNSNCNVSR